MTLRDKLAAVN